jgi:hypothetical protein
MRNKHCTIKQLSALGPQASLRCFHAFLQWPICIDDSFRQRDFFKSGFDFKVQVESSVRCQVRRVFA